MEQTFGRYRLLEALGKGGMAEVFKAKSFGVEGFEKVLVIKRILPELATNQAFVDMFVHEAKLVVRLSHANIVQVFDLGRVESADNGASYFIAMEYVAGLDLASLLARARRRTFSLPLGMCVYVTAEIAKGLDHAHRRRDEQMRQLGIVHRDVSPQNVLLSWEGEVKVTDFGIAKARDIMEDRSHHENKTSQLKGKYAYMSPEQASGNVVDSRSDIFSVGTVFYELLAGVNPFAAATPHETLRRVQAAEFPPIELLRQDVHPELAVILRKTLMKSVDGRIENAGRLYEELLAFMYSSGTRFSANDLAQFLADFKEADLGELYANDVLGEGSPSSGGRTPVEVPHSESKGDTSTSGRGSLVPSASLGERREVTTLVLTFGASRDASLPTHLRARVKDTLARYGARLVDEEPLQMVSLFGLGESDGRDTETAVRCALVLLRQLSAGRFSPSAGVHIGRVILHASGEPARDARLTSLISEAQELARVTEGRCIVSSAAARHVRSMFVLEPLPEGARAGVSPGGSLIGELRSADDSLGRFVGRKPQLRRMGEVLAIATRKNLQVVTVHGEQGIGKTRFLYEVERRIRKGDYAVAFYLASCPPRGKESPLAGLTAMLQVLCGVSEGDPIERVMGVEPRLRALGLTDEERNAVLGQLGAARSPQAGPSLPPLRAAFARMVQSLCEDRLHVFVWDNAHALDDESIDILTNVTQRLSNIRGVFVFSTRAETSAGLCNAASSEVIELGELDTEDTTKLVALRIGLGDAPLELVSFCRERAGGHPLFIEELIKELVETNALTVKNNSVITLKLTGDVAVPRPLRSLLASRVARLDAERKATLQAAAVLGDPIDSSVLGTILGLTIQQVDRTISELEARSLMRRLSPSTAALASPMLRDAVLDALPVERKRELHATAAAAYESVQGGSSEENANRIAIHLFESGDRNKAAGYFAISGRNKLRTGQLEASVHDLLKALDLADLQTRAPAELAVWLKDLHSAVHRVRSAPALADILARVLSRIDANGVPADRIEARVRAAATLGSTHQFEAAQVYLEQALQLARSERSLQSRVHLTVAELMMRQGYFSKALGSLQRIHSPEELDRDDAYRMEVIAAHVQGATGDRKGGLEHLDKATDLANPADLAAAVEREKIRGLVLHFNRDFRGATSAFERGVDLSRAAGLSYEVALALHNMGDSLVWLSNFARAHVAFRESAAICQEYGYERLFTHNKMYLAFLDAEKGHINAAETLHQFIAYSEAKGYIWDVLDGRYLLATLAYRRHDEPAARKELILVRDLAVETHNQLLGQWSSEMLEQLASWPSEKQ